MSRVRAFFVEEAGECLEEAGRALAQPAPDVETLYAAVRKLRGSAQVARFGALADRAASLEEALRGVARDGASWDDDLGRRVGEGLDALEQAVDAVRRGRTEPDERESPMDEREQNGSESDVVGIETLEYRGQDALERAQELREPLEDAIVDGDPPGAIIDEIFDLIRLGTE